MGKCINVSGTVNTAPGENNFRFTSRDNTTGMRSMMHMWWNEMASLYGMGVDYYVHGYTLSSHDFLYGEEPTAAFNGPVPMVILGIMESDSMLLSKFGIQTNSDFTAIIPRSIYADKYGPTAEPKSGDIIRLSEWGCDRPGACGDAYSAEASAYPLTQDQVCENVFSTVSATSSTVITSPSGYTCGGEFCQTLNFGEIRRCPYLFEVTQRRDDNVTQGYNVFMGHYVWILYCKRFDYSYEPGIGPECGNQTVSDEMKDIGLQPGGTQDPSPEKKYDQNVEDDSDRVWDYDRAPGNNTDPYGNY
jgi:hypothetical protein